MIKAIIFDFAGVIGADAYWNWLEKNVPNLEEKRQYFEEIANKADRGTITNSEFAHSIAKESLTSSEKIWPEIFKENIINDKLLVLIKSLKRHYKIGLLSNFNHEWLEEIFKKHSLYEYIDEVFISSEHGYIKPEKEAFQTILDLLHITKNEAIFVDDRPGNVDAGNKFGLKTFLYVNNEKLKQDLQGCGVKL